MSVVVVVLILCFMFKKSRLKSRYYAHFKKDPLQVLAAITRIQLGLDNPVKKHEC